MTLIINRTFTNEAGIEVLVHIFDETTPMHAHVALRHEHEDVWGAPLKQLTEMDQKPAPTEIPMHEAVMPKPDEIMIMVGSMKTAICVTGVTDLETAARACHIIAEMLEHKAKIEVTTT